MDRPIFALPEAEKQTDRTNQTTLSHLLVTTPNTSTNNFNISDMEDVSLTIVTAYIDIGTIRKGKNAFWRHPRVYWDWTQIFGHLLNPLVANISLV